MAFEWLEHTADIGVRGIGRSMEEAFCEAARGMFAMMVDLEDISGQEELEVCCRAPSHESLLVAWLAELIAQKDLAHSLFSSFEVKIDRKPEGFVLHGWCRGDVIDPARQRLGTEVKGISVCGLRVEPARGLWVAECIVDV